MPRWDPFKEFISIQERIDSMFDEVLLKDRNCSGVSYGVWSPPVDVYETENEIVMKAELPGLDKDDFNIEVKDNVIILQGERRFEKNFKEENYNRMERPYGTFKRVFNLPNTVDRNEVKAHYEGGVLEITVPKAVEPEPKKIKVEVE